MVVRVRAFSGKFAPMMNHTNAKWPWSYCSLMDRLRHWLPHKPSGAGATYSVKIKCDYFPFLSLKQNRTPLYTEQKEWMSEGLKKSVIPEALLGKKILQKSIIVSLYTHYSNPSFTAIKSPHFLERLPTKSRTVHIGLILILFQKHICKIWHCCWMRRPLTLSLIHPKGVLLFFCQVFPLVHSHCGKIYKFKYEWKAFNRYPKNTHCFVVLYTSWCSKSPKSHFR